MTGRPGADDDGRKTLGRESVSTDCANRTGDLTGSRLVALGALKVHIDKHFFVSFRKFIFQPAEACAIARVPASDAGLPERLQAFIIGAIAGNKKGGDQCFLIQYRGWATDQPLLIRSPERGSGFTF